MLSKIKASDYISSGYSTVAKMDKKYVFPDEIMENKDSLAVASHILDQIFVAAFDISYLPVLKEKTRMLTSKVMTNNQKALSLIDYIAHPAFVRGGLRSDLFPIPFGETPEEPPAIVHEPNAREIVPI